MFWLCRSQLSVHEKNMVASYKMPIFNKTDIGKKIESESQLSGMRHSLKRRKHIRFRIFHHEGMIWEDGMQGIPMLRRSVMLAAATSSEAAEQQSVTTVVL